MDGMFLFGFIAGMVTGAIALIAFAMSADDE